MKKLALLFALLLSVLTIFVACEKTGETSTPSNDSTQENNSSTQTSKTEDSSTQSSKTEDSSTQVSVSSTQSFVSYEIILNNPRTTYMVGEEFSTAGVRAKGYYADGKNTNLSAGQYTIDYSSYDKTTPGVYTIKVVAGTEEKTYDVRVIEKIEVVSNVVNIKIDASYTGTPGSKDANNMSQFAKIGDAIQVLEGIKLDNAIIKNFHIASGKYEEQISISSALKNIRFLGENPETTVISYSECSSQAGGTDNSSTLMVKCEGFILKNITVENSYDYNNDTQYADKQAVAMTLEADKCVISNCIFKGYQDTLQPKAGRQYYKNCVIMGCVDYIFGNNATALFENCEIRTLKRANSNEYVITAQKGNKGINGKDVPQYGYVFKGCNLTFEDGVIAGSTTLGRPWRADATVAWIDCQMGAHISKNAYNKNQNDTRYRGMKGTEWHEPQNAHFVEYGNTGDGAITEAVLGCTMLTSAEYANYTYANIFATTNGMVTYTGEFDAVGIYNQINA